MPPEDEPLPPISPELQAEFDEWEAASEEDLRKFEAGEYDGGQQDDPFLLSAMP